MESLCIFCGTAFETEQVYESPICRGCADKKTRAITKMVKEKTGSRHGDIHIFREK